jgi:hypothetical protein
MVYRVQQLASAYKMHQTIKTQQSGFIELAVPLNGFKSNRSGEITYHGKLYDVKSYAVSGNVVVMKVLNDVEEENVIHLLQSIWSHSNNNHNGRLDKLLDILTALYLPPASQIQYAVCFYSEPGYSLFHELFISRHNEISLPPPRHIA